MRVAVDSTSLLNQPTGVGAFTRALLAGLAEVERVDVLAFALSWRGRGRLASAVPAGIEVSSRPLPARPLRAAWLRSDLPRLDHLIGPHDIVHGTNYVVPPSSARQVVSVHDLTPVLFPEMCTDDVLQFPALVRRAIDRGAWVQTESNHVRDEVIEHFAVPAERVRVVPHALEEVIAGDANRGQRIAGAARYVLALGTVEPRKGLPLLVRAFDALAAEDPDLHLVHAGPSGMAQEAFDGAIASAAHRGRVRQLGYVSDADRAHVLAGAAVFAYPSIYEGFGIPPLEAMASGTPVVTSDAGSLVEIAGAGSLQVGVGDVDTLTDALRQVLTDEPLRRDLIQRGHTTAAAYTSERLVDGMLALYDDLLAA